MKIWIHILGPQCAMGWIRALNFNVTAIAIGHQLGLNPGP